MYTQFEAPQAFNELNDRMRAAGASILEAANPTRLAFLLDANADLTKLDQSDKHLYTAVEGVLSFHMDGKVLFLFEEGDLVVPKLYAQLPNSAVCSNFGVKLNEYPLCDLRQTVAADVGSLANWQDYCFCHTAMSTLMLGAVLPEELAIAPEIRCYDAGKNIITEGSAAEEVFNLVEGRAEVFVGDQKVGEIKPDEIFGVMALLGGARRSARVTTVERSVVAAVRGVDFVRLIQSRPGTVLKMVEDMARTIAALNEEVVSLRGQRRLA